MLICVSPESGNVCVHAQESHWMCFCFVFFVCVSVFDAHFDVGAHLCSSHLWNPTHGQLCLKCRSNKWHERRCLKWRSGEGQLDTFGKCRTTSYERSSKWISLLPSSWNPREGRKTQHVLSIYEQQSGLFPQFVQMHAMADWCLEGQCNWVLEESLSWGTAPCLPLWYLWHRVSCCKTSDIWDERNNTYCVKHSNQQC